MQTIESTDFQTARKVRYFVRLHYPLQIVMTDSGFFGRFPDLPGCEYFCSGITQLYAELERNRRAWIADRLLAGKEVPLPNGDRQQVEDQPNVAVRPGRISRESSQSISAAAS